MPDGVFFHNKLHDIPQLVVQPRTTHGLSLVLGTLSKNGIYERFSVSVKSGGHSYFADSSCTGVVIDLARMSHHVFLDDGTLMVEPGVAIGNLVYAFHQAGKVVPHGDCASVCVGGHWSTAGWDVLLSRSHGLGSQNIRRAEVVLWDGTILEASETAHPELFWSLKGGGAAEVGVVSRFWMQTFDEPETVSLCRLSLCREDLVRLVAEGFTATSYDLPDCVSTIIDYVYAPAGGALCCSVEFFSTRGRAETMEILRAHFPAWFLAKLADTAEWIGERVFDIRIAPYTDHVKNNPSVLAEMSAADMTRCQELLWTPEHLDREMRHAYFQQRSYWLNTDDSRFLLSLFDFFESIEGRPLRRHSYGAVIIGGGQISARQADSSMPIGSAVARFETHWDVDSEASRGQAAAVAAQFSTALAPHVEHIRPYRGDIWAHSQKLAGSLCSQIDARLHAVMTRYNRRPRCQSPHSGDRSPYEAARPPHTLATEHGR